MATNTSTLGTLDTAWKARTGHYVPPVAVLTDQTQVSIAANGDGTEKTFTVAHNLAKVPSVVVMTPSAGVSSAKHTVTVDATNVIVKYSVAPVVGVGNVVLAGMAAY